MMLRRFLVWLLIATLVLPALPAPIADAQVKADTVGNTLALGALNAHATVALAGEQGAIFHLAAGTLTGTVVPEVSLDGGNTWISAVLLHTTTGGLATSLALASPSHNESRTIGYPGAITHARVRVSAYTSGTANATLRAVTTRPFNVAYGTDGSTIRALSVTSGGNVNVVCVSGCGGSGGTSAVDDAGFTVAVDSYTPAGGTYRATLDTVDDGDGGAFAMTARRSIHASLRREADGGEIGTSAAPLHVTASVTVDSISQITTSVTPGTSAGHLGKAEDADHASGDTGVAVWAIRRDHVSTVSSSSPGEYASFNVDSAGRLWTVIGAGHVAATQIGTWATNLAQIAGTTTATHYGVSGIGVQRVQVATDQTYVVHVSAAMVGFGDYLNVFNASGSSKVIRVRRITMSVRSIAAVTGVMLSASIDKTSTAGTTCTAVTVQPYDSTNDAVPSQITGNSLCTTDPTSTFTMMTCSVTTEESVTNNQPYSECYVSRPDSQPLTLREGEGVMVRNDGTSIAAAGTIGITIEFTISGS